MNDNPRSVPYCTADYLKTPEDIAAYLNVALEEEDDQLLRHALQDVAVALSRQSNQQVNLAHLDLSGLLSMLHALDLELSIQPRHKVA